MDKEQKKKSTQERRKAPPPPTDAALIEKLRAQPPAVWEDHRALVRWADNPRKNRAAVVPVAISILEHGFGAPIVARLANKRLIAGDTRLQAVTLIWQHEDGHVLKGKDEDGDPIEATVGPIVGIPERGFVPVRYLDVSEEDADRLARADNRLGEIATWDDGRLLAQVLADQKADPDRLRRQGFSRSYVDRLLKRAAPPSEFPVIGPQITVTHTCPRCNYQW